MQRTFFRSNYWPSLFVTAVLAFAFIPGLTPKRDALASTKRAPKHIQDLKTSAIPELKLGVPTERQLAGTDQHNYRMTLTKGQYVNVVALQKSIDLVLALFGPTGEKLSEVDTTGGPEVLFMVAEVDGNYRLEVRASDKEAIRGLYELRITELREATTRDGVAVAAERLFEEGNKLRDQRTAESRRNAIKKYEEALPLWRDARDTRGEALTLNELGVVHSNLGEPRKAVEYYATALPLALTAGDKIIEATTLTNMGTAYWRSGELQKALESQKQALLAVRTAGDSQLEGAILGNTGAVYSALGEPQEALEYFNQALVIARARGDRRRQAITLNNIASIDQQLGNLQKALESHTEVIVLRRAVGDRQGEATSLNNLALLHTQLGDFQKALEYYDQALTIRRAGGERQAQATNLQGISLAYLRMKELGPARKYADEALTLARAVSDSRLEAYVLDIRGKVQQLSGEPKKALDDFEQSLSLRRKLGDRYGEAYALSNVAGIYLASGSPAKALEHYLQSAELSREIGDRLGGASTFFGIARVHRAMGNNVSARTEIERALAIVESTRTSVTSQDVRSLFLASYQEFFQFYIDLLMQMHQEKPSAGFDGLALHANERARARSLLEILTEARAQIRQGVDPALLESERSTQQQLNIRAERQVRLLSGKHTAEQEATARKEVEALLSSYRDVQAQIRTRSPRYAALTQPQPLTLKEVQEQVLDDDTLLLEYAMGDERSYLWAVTPTSISAFALPKRAEIELAARRVYDLITARNQSLKFEESAKRQARVARADAEYSEAAAGLSRMLLGPIANQMKGKRLLIVSDGVLQYIPFAALPIPQKARVNNQSSRSTGTRGRLNVETRPLISEHEIISLPSASSLAVLRRELRGRQTAAKVIAVVADPVFQADDPRVKGPKPNGSLEQPAMESSKTGTLEGEMQRSARDVGEVEFRRLPYTRQEGIGIVAFAPKQLRREFLDFEASRSDVTIADLSDYKIVHFATHGFLNSQHPELSGIVLSLVDEQGRSQDGFLRLHEIYNLKLGADLVVLSACRTALGKEIRGEGLVGLTRGFMYAGAPRVVASLWAVEDQATAELMKRFYREMLVRKQRPAAALRTAQVSLWRDKRLPAYYWAGFMLQGEWK